MKLKIWKKKKKESKYKYRNKTTNSPEFAEIKVESCFSEKKKKKKTLDFLNLPPSIQTRVKREENSLNCRTSYNDRNKRFLT